mmetsp:Transcript_158066/g.383871  ORF Transcript_158066/g.383871 Transcript_158066/m.383871 type:complete len:311 (-) Transcript_158066:1217-2149(-)
MPNLALRVHGLEEQPQPLPAFVRRLAHTAALGRRELPLVAVAVDLLRYDKEVGHEEEDGVPDEGDRVNLRCPQEAPTLNIHHHQCLNPKVEEKDELPASCNTKTTVFPDDEVVLPRLDHEHKVQVSRGSVHCDVGNHPEWYAYELVPPMLLLRLPEVLEPHARRLSIILDNLDNLELRVIAVLVTAFRCISGILKDFPDNAASLGREPRQVALLPEHNVGSAATVQGAVIQPGLQLLGVDCELLQECLPGRGQVISVELQVQVVQLRETVDHPLHALGLRQVQEVVADADAVDEPLHAQLLLQQALQLAL